LRPPAVLILARKPCVLARWILLGWYVRFTILFLKIKNSFYASNHTGEAINKSRGKEVAKTG
jgi:hypothetical protein